MTVFLRLRSCARNRNYDITQHQLTAVRVKTVISLFRLQKIERSRRRIIYHRERKHVCLPVNVSVLPVHGADIFRIGQNQFYFCLIRARFLIQHTIDYRCCNLFRIKSKVKILFIFKRQCHLFSLRFLVVLFALPL